LPQNIALPADNLLEFKARIFKTIGDPNRLKILEILRNGENCQCEIIPLIEQSQPTVSRHLKLLEEAGLIKSRKDGTRVFYTVVDTHIFNLLDAIDEDMIELISEELIKNIGV
jgi:ArsR family transcriptional regulator, arsenate/arsenite/antimonite-responsive transcriptional repressor